MSIDGLYTRVIVCRVGDGAMPFTWNVVGINPGSPIHISSERFRSMAEAYSAGQARLAEFLPSKPALRGRRVRPDGQALASAIDWNADEADETGLDDTGEADGAAGQDSQPHPAMPDERATYVNPSERTAAG